MKAPKSYLTTAFSASLKAQKARIANLFAQNRRKSGAALALLCVLLVSVGALVSCQPKLPAPAPVPAPTLTPIPISADAGFYDGETLHVLGEGLVPLLDGGDEYLMPPHLDGRQVNRRWKNASDGSYHANSYYTVDRISGNLRLNCFQWTVPALSTARGAKVGDRLADVQALYPEAELTSDTLYFRDDDCQVVFEFWEDAVSQISLYTERFPITVNNAFPYNAIPLGGERELRDQYLYPLDPDDEDALWALEPPVTDALSLYAAFSPDRSALLLQADHAALAIDSAALNPELMKHADTLSVDFGRGVEFLKNGNALSVTLPVLLHDPYAGDFQFAPEGAISQEVAVFSADIVHLPGADCYTYTNFRLDTDLPQVPMPTDQPPELTYETTAALDPGTGIRRATLVSGEVPLECWFEIPVFSGDSPGYAAINEFFSELSDSFFSPENENLTEAWGAANYSPQATPTNHFYYRHNAVVRSHDDSLLSVTIDWEWWIGGVHNSGWDCYNFDPATGEQVLLSDLISESEDEALVAIHRAMLADDELRYSVTPGDYLVDDPYDLLGRSLDSFDFFVANGKVYLAFDCYEATCGAGGSPVLEVPLALR